MDALRLEGQKLPFVVAAKTDAEQKTQYAGGTAHVGVTCRMTAIRPETPPDAGVHDHRACSPDAVHAVRLIAVLLPDDSDSKRATCKLKVIVFADMVQLTCEELSV